MAKELTTSQKKEWAQMLFLSNQYNQKEISKKVGVTEATMSKWVKEGFWENRRRSLMNTKPGLLAFYYDVLSKLRDKIQAADGIGDAKDADKVVKYSASIKSLEKDTSIGELMDAGNRFRIFEMEHDPAFAQKFIDRYDAFIQDELKKL